MKKLFVAVAAIAFVGTTAFAQLNDTQARKNQKVTVSDTTILPSTDTTITPSNDNDQWNNNQDQNQNQNGDTTSQPSVDTSGAGGAY